MYEHKKQGRGGQEKLVSNNVVRASHQPKLRFPLNMVPCFVLLARCDFDEIQKKGQKVIERTRKGERDKETERQRERQRQRETEKPDQKGRRRQNRSAWLLASLWWQRVYVCVGKVTIFAVFFSREKMDWNHRQLLCPKTVESAVPKEESGRRSQKGKWYLRVRDKKKKKRGKMGDDGDAATKAFVQWCLQQGITFSPKVTITTKDVVHGRGLLALEDIAANELLFEIPRSGKKRKNLGGGNERMSES